MPLLVRQLKWRTLMRIANRHDISKLIRTPLPSTYRSQSPSLYNTSSYISVNAPYIPVSTSSIFTISSTDACTIPSPLPRVCVTSVDEAGHEKVCLGALLIPITLVTRLGVIGLIVGHRLRAIVAPYRVRSPICTILIFAQIQALSHL